MTRKKKPRTKPQVAVTRQETDGTLSTTVLPWEQAYGHENVAVQALFEHNHLLNTVLSKESDRGIAVLGPAYLDTLLEDLLRAFFRVTKSTDKILDGDRALGTFSSRIDIAHALGFIDDPTWHDLHLARDIRNDFAHSVDLHSLDVPTVRDRCRAFECNKGWDDMRTRWSGREAFLMAMTRLVVEIANGIRYVKRRTLVPSSSTPNVDPNE